jgi:hypothetical protein
VLVTKVLVTKVLVTKVLVTKAVAPKALMTEPKLNPFITTRSMMNKCLLINC